MSYINYEVMTDTQNRYRTDPELIESVDSSIKGTLNVHGCDEIQGNARSKRIPEIRVINRGCLEAAQAYKGKKTAVLDFASAFSVGGHPFSSHAQEESICQRSTLLPCLEAQEESFYGRNHREGDASSAPKAIGTDNMLYVPGVKIFKKATTLPNGLEGAEMMDRSEWFDVDIIVSAAPHLHDERSFGEKELMSVYKRRLGRVLDIAENQGIEALILGAYGCGAFRNDPHLIAKAFHELLTENEYGFAVVEFAIIYHGDSKNFDAFVKEFGNA